MKTTIKKALNNDNVEYREFYNALLQESIGDWDSINSTDVIQEYLCEKIKEGIHVSHIVEALEKEYSKYEDWSIWLGNSMETPTPINSKQDLIEALGLEDDELEQEIDIE